MGQVPRTMALSLQDSPCGVQNPLGIVQLRRNIHHLRFGHVRGIRGALTRGKYSRNAKDSRGIRDAFAQGKSLIGRGFP